MRLILSFSFFLFITACNEDVEQDFTSGAVSIPIGTYHSNCGVVGSNDSQRQVLVLDSDSRSITQESFTGNPFCNGTPASVSAADAAEIEISEETLSEDVSYYEDSVLGFVPYYINGSDLYIGSPIVSFNGGDPKDIFAGFISAPIPNTITVFRLQ